MADRVDPADLQATVYRCMGLEPRQVIHDELQRPWEISTGRVVGQLLG